MEYDINRTEFVKTHKTKYFIQTSKHIFQIYIDCILYIYLHIFFIYIAYVFKSYFLLCSYMFCEMFYLFCCFMLAELKCFCASPTLMCLLSNTLQYNGFLRMETQLNMKLQMNYLQKDN